MIGLPPGLPWDLIETTLVAALVMSGDPDVALTYFARAERAGARRSGSAGVRFFGT